MMTPMTRTTIQRLFVLVLALGLIFQAVPSLAAGPVAMAGHWEGKIQLPGTALDIQIDFTLKPDGSWSGAISIPAQGAKDMPLSNIVVSGSDVAFDLPGVPGNPKFKGQADATGSKIEGTFTQGPGSFPFVLERKADPAAMAKEALAGFDTVANDALKKLKVPGMAIAIVKGKEIIYSQGFGYRDVEKQLPVTPNTLFAIGSSTKAFTTFVLGTLVDEGKVEWDKPVRNYIPWFRLYDPSASERITPRDLVTHRSGLPRHDFVWYNNYGASRESLVRRLAYLQPNADLREKFQYNNLMFLTAGYLEEVLTGGTWEDAVRQRILIPLEMKRTNFSVADSQKDPDFAQPYRKTEERIEKIPFRPITNIGPAGAINSCVAEMSHWLIVHLNGGRYEGKVLANAATVRDLHTSQMAIGVPSTRPDISPPDYAMGWFVNTYRGHELVEHGGNIDGFSANVVLFPQDDLGIVVLTNMNATPLPELIGRLVADRILKLTPVNWIGEAAGRQSVAEEADKEAKKKKEIARIPGKPPAHPLEDYTGDYENPGYGPLKIALHEARLEATYNGITTPLEAWHYETFNGLKAKDPIFENMKFTFETNPDGFVASVSAPFEPSVKDIVFTKKPDARLFDAQYLKNFVGTFELPGQALVIALKGNVLTASLPGQPVLELVPELGGWFSLKGVSVVSLRFQLDEKGQASSIDVRQPNGVYTAKKKEAPKQ